MPDVELIPESRVRGKRTGWHRHHKETNRDFPVTPRLAAAVPLAPKRWGRATVPLDQGEVGSCTGNACDMACFEMPGRAGAVRKTEPVAVRLYVVATDLDDVPGYYRPGDPASQDTGSTTVGVLSAAKQRGYVGSYRWAFSFDEALRTVAQVGPVITGVDWFEGFDRPTPAGELVIGGSVRGGHELCLDRIVPDDAQAGGGWVEGFNSWGRAWGPIGGRFRWTWATWRALLERGGEVGVGLAAGA